MNTFFSINTCCILLFLCVLFSCTTHTHERNKTTTSRYTDLVISESSDYLFAISKDSIPQLGSQSAFINSRRDTIIPFGTYSHNWTDTFKTYAIVCDKIHTNGVTVGIDKNQHILFDIVFFDNWPDELHDGLFRVKRNEKIGFANSKGEIVIPCQFECAFWFEKNRAKVTYHCTTSTDGCGHTIPESAEWFYIDTQGKKIE